MHSSHLRQFRWFFNTPNRLILTVVLIVAIFAALSLSTTASAQQLAVASSRSLITQPVDETKLKTLVGNTHPLAKPVYDLGTAPATLSMDRMLLVLKRSTAQESALRKLLDDQQDKASPNYHKWLTPDQFGKQFGPSDADIQKITAWLQSHGFQVGTTKGRTVLEFSGSASQVQETFHTTIHKYIVNGEQHWANASDPQIPVALVPAVAGVFTLHNFIKKPAIHFSGEAIPAKLVPDKKPQVTFPPQNGEAATNALAPEDFAVIYNINPLYSVDLDGNGTSIAVVGRSNLFNNGEDVQDFDNAIKSGNGFNSADFSIVLNGPDPGDLGGGEEAEATLDTTWSGAIAPGTTVSLVVSATTNTTDGIDLSETYIVENNLAGIMTESFSSCELYATDTELAGASALAEQAAAQGITYFVSTGDDGAEGCDDPNNPPATNPISVNYFASTPFNVAVGGTMFNENGDPSLYWTSNPPISETAISYIPENVWNESSLSNGLWSSSGGASAGNIASGVGTTPGVLKPSWQSGVTGIQPDGVRDVPDVSLTAAGHDPYLLCLEGSCEPNAQGEIFVYFISGTSASAPSFAGIMALVDQQMTARQGLANYVLYRLAATQSAYPSQCDGSNTSTPPASNCIFNDITVGNNVVPGEVGTEYQAGTGYDMTTGLGSVNVANLVDQWGTVTFNPTTTALTLNGGTAVNITHGQSVPVKVTVTPNSGTGTPTGDAVLLTSATNGPSTMNLYPLSGGKATSSTSQLPGGMSYNVWAHYAGDNTYAPSDSNQVSVTVGPESSTTTESIFALAANGNGIPLNAVPFGSFVYIRADVVGNSGFGVPTGTVNFTDTFGAIPGGNAFPLNGGDNGLTHAGSNTADPQGILFDAGTHTISAAYSGDASFSPSSTTQSQSFTITPGFLAAVVGNESTVVVSSPGMQGSLAMTVSTSTNFTGTVTFACSGLPVGAQCTFTPSQIAASGKSNSTNVTIAVSTTAAATATLEPKTRSRFLAQWMIGVGMVLPGLLLCGKRQRGRVLLLMLMLTMLVVVPSCGGGGGGGSSSKQPAQPTPAGTTNVTVTATSGSNSCMTGFTLVVQ